MTAESYSSLDMNTSSSATRLTPGLFALEAAFAPALIEFAFWRHALSISSILVVIVHAIDVCPIFPHLKHSPLATGLVPGVSGYGLVS